MKIVKLWGVNNEGMPIDYPDEIILNHPENEPLPEGYQVLTDNEIQAKTEAYKNQVIAILEKKNRQRKYICNDSFEDPSNMLIDLLPLKSKKIYDPITNKCIATHHYKDYDLVTDLFSNLAVRETYTTYYNQDSSIKAQQVKMDWLLELFADDIESEIIGKTKTVINTMNFII